MGGVLVGLDKHRCIAALDAIGAQKIAEYVDEHRSEDLFHELELGHITPSQFCDEARRIGNFAASDDKIIDAWNALLTDIDVAKRQRLAELRQRYRVFLLSNTNVLHWNKCANELFPYNGLGVNDFFERIFLSYEMDMVKPDAEIYEAVLQETKINPTETIFIDDSEKNCNAAAALGIQVFHEKSGCDWLEKIQ